MYSLILMSALSTAPDTAAFGGSIRDTLFGGGSCTGCSGSDSRTRAESDDRASCHGNSCHGIFGGRIRSFFSFGGGCGGSGGSGNDHRDRDSLARSASTCHGNTCHGYAADRASCLGWGSERGSSCLGSTYAISCQGGLPSASCYGLGLGSLTPNYPGFPDVGVPSIPGGFAYPSTAPSYFNGPAPLYYDSSPQGCFGSSGTPGIPAMIEGPGNGRMLPPAGEYPTIAPPSLPTVPMPMPFDRPATPTPAPAPTSLPEIPSYRQSTQNIPAVAATGANRGSIMVRLPADAKLLAEGRQLTVTNGEKTFLTPPLPTNTEAVYTFRVEYSRGGEMITQSKKVTVRAGENAMVVFDDLMTRADNTDKSSVENLPKSEFLSTSTKSALPALPSFPAVPKGTPTIMPPPLGTFMPGTTISPKAPETNPTRKAAEDRAKLVIKLPASAVLFVDGKRNPRTESVREFTTPPLKAGQEYSYVLRSEIPGQSNASQEIKIEFTAGMSLIVDFTNPSRPLQIASAK